MERKVKSLFACAKSDLPFTNRSGMLSRRWTQAYGVPQRAWESPAQSGVLSQRTRCEDRQR